MIVMAGLGKNCLPKLPMYKIDGTPTSWQGKLIGENYLDTVPILWTPAALKIPWSPVALDRVFYQGKAFFGSPGYVLRPPRAFIYTTDPGFPPDSGQGPDDTERTEEAIDGLSEYFDKKGIIAGKLWPQRFRGNDNDQGNGASHLPWGMVQGLLERPNFDDPTPNNTQNFIVDPTQIKGGEMLVFVILDNVLMTAGKYAREIDPSEFDYISDTTDYDIYGTSHSDGSGHQVADAASFRQSIT